MKCYLSLDLSKLKNVIPTGSYNWILIVDLGTQHSACTCFSSGHSQWMLRQKELKGNMETYIEFSVEFSNRLCLSSLVLLKNSGADYLTAIHLEISLAFGRIFANKSSLGYLNVLHKTAWDEQVCGPVN